MYTVNQPLYFYSACRDPTLVSMNILGRPITPRVGQIDASLLDSELQSQLKDKLWAAFKVFRPDIKDNYEPELLLMLKLVLFKATIWDYSTTYGAKLQNLKLVNSASNSRVHIPISKQQKLLYGLATIGGGYLWTKVNEFLGAASYDSAEMPRVVRLRAFAEKLSALWLAASLFNFLSFLYSGTYSTLLLRLLKMKYIPVSRKVNRMVNFEFQNRQLVWNAMTEFLMFLLPLINFARLKRTLLKFVTQNQPPTGTLSFLPEKACPICYEKDASISTITNPYQTPCGHIYCYVCIKLKLEEDPDGWACARCGQQVKSATPY